MAPLFFQNGTNLARNLNCVVV